MTVDASPCALGAILEKKLEHSDAYKVVAYASRSLNEVEKRYLQTEREALAVVWGCEHFQFFLLGIKFELFTDNKALFQIYSHTFRPSAKIERWVLRLQLSDFEIKYKKGTENPADASLRLSIRSEMEKSRSVNDDSP